MKIKRYYIIGGAFVVLFIVFLIGKAVTPKTPQQHIPAYQSMKVANTGNSMQNGVNGILGNQNNNQQSGTTANSNASLWDNSQHGILALQGTNANGMPQSLALLNPDNLSVIAQITLPFQNGQGYTLSVTDPDNNGVNNINNNWNTVLALSNNYRYVPLTFDKESDGSQHVGYLDLETNSVTDISPSTKSGFSSQVTVDQGPMFDPTNSNILLFQRNGQAYQYDLTTKQTQPSNIDESQAVPQASECLFDGSVSCRLQDNTQTSSTSNVGFVSDGVVNMTPGAVVSLAIFSAPEDNASWTSIVTSNNQDDAVVCSPEFWLNGSNLVCLPPDGSNFLNVNLGAKSQTTDAYGTAYYQVPKPTTLLHVNDRNNGNPVLSYDGKTIIFQSTQGSNTNVYSVSSSGGTPKEITQLDGNNSSLEFIDWR